MTAPPRDRRRRPRAAHAVLHRHPRVHRRGPFSRLTRRILVINLLGLAILVGGLFFVGQYRAGLIDAKIESLRTEAEIIAAALAESAVSERAGSLAPAPARTMVRRLVAPIGIRARLFGADGALLVDSRRLRGAGGLVQIEHLPQPAVRNAIERVLDAGHEWIAGLLPGQRLPRYRENPVQTAADYEECVQALKGEWGSAVRASTKGVVISVAVPVQRFKQVQGALMLSAGSADIDEGVREVRLAILKVSAPVLAITILLSLYLAGTIARPVRRLAEAAERVRGVQGERLEIPDFTGRGDEIGDLSAALRDMTEELWRRMDAVEAFAADVAHEIKNPLSSLRSAVETTARVSDPADQRKLMDIILDDVQRLDRLISDISNASRLEAELSRAAMEPVDISRLLAALVQVNQATADAAAARLEIDLPAADSLVVPGIQDRLVQVFQNLLANARTFSPPGGVIRIAAVRDVDAVRVVVEDQGPGIPDGKREAIFERFYSERPEAEKFGSHSGLGLSISRQIVEAHGGTVVATNIPGRGGPAGARFTVHLPLAE